MPTARQVKLIGKYKFVEADLNRGSEMFVVYITVLEAPMLIITVHPIRKLLLVA